jgi:serine/threonine protein kinase/WD40 repeat protein
MPETPGRERTIFDQARNLSAGERSAYLDRTCGGDTELRRQVEQLLQTDGGTPNTGDPETPTTVDASEWPTDMPQPALPGMRIGRYKLIQEIGEGGGGVVFLADQEEPVRRRVALKIIRLGMDTEEVIARFQVERQALALMDHPNIAKVLDAGATPTGRPYFVMELVKGSKITEYCDTNRLTIDERLRLFLPVCQALLHAHQKGIIHRDIKPSNILVSSHDGAPVPKVIDFGIAKATGGRLTDQTLYTSHEHFFGTPAYMSPEQAGAEGNVDVDTRSDVYSLGVLLYELLTGVTPLDRKKLEDLSEDEVRRHIREVEPPRPSARLAAMDAAELAEIAQKRRLDPRKLIAQLRGDLDWIVMKCLEIPRQRRYDSASALAADVQRHLDNEPVSAGPPSTLYRLGKFARRHQAALATATVFVVLLLGSTAVSLWLAQRAETAATEANEQRKVAEQQRAEADKQKLAVQVAYNRMDVTAALSQLEQNNPNQAVAYLTRALRPAPDNRNAESLLYSVLSTQNWLLPTANVPSNTTVLAVNPASGRVATIGDNNMVRVTDLATGRLLATMTQESLLLSMAFSANGNRLLTLETNGLRGSANRGFAGPGAGARGRGGDNGGPPIGNRGRGTGLRQNQPGRGPRGGGPDVLRGIVRVWEAGTGQALTPANPFPTGVSFPQLSVDGTKIFLVFGNPANPSTPVRGPGGITSSAGIFDVATGQPMYPTINFSADILAAGWSADGSKIAVAWRENGPGNAGGLLGVWDLITGRPVFTPMRTEGLTRSVVFSPDGAHLATTSGDFAYIWDAATGQVLPNNPQHDGTINDAVFSANSLAFATASDDGTARMWSTATGRGYGEPMRHESPVRTVAFSNNGQYLITGSADDTARLWQAGTPESAGKPWSAPMLGGGEVSGAYFNPDGRSALTEAGGWGVEKWNFPDGNVATRPIVGLTPNAFSKDGRRFVALAPDGAVWVYDTATLQPVSPALHRDGAVQAAAALHARLSADGKLLALEMDNRSVRVWDVATGQAVSPVIPLENRVGGHNLELSEDGKKLLAMTNESTARVWDATTGQALSAPLQHDGNVPIFAAAFSADGQDVLTAATDREVRVWDMATGNATTAALRLEATVLAATFSPDGQRLLAAGNNTARVWDVGNGRPLSAPMRADSNITAVAFSPDGSGALTMTGSPANPAAARFWDATTGAPASLAIAPGASNGRPSGPDAAAHNAAWMGALRLWARPTPPPAWVLDLAETLAQCKVDSTGAPVFDQGLPLDKLRTSASTPGADAANPFVEWARAALGVNSSAASGKTN